MPGTKTLNEFFIVRAMQCILNRGRNGKGPRELTTFYNFKLHTAQQATKLFNFNSLSKIKICRDSNVTQTLPALLL